MRLALQALFSAYDDKTEEGRKNRERIERELRNNERSGRFVRKFRDVVTDPQLKAPEIFAEESFPDANIVAEYLDCQSESQEIRDEYEKVCSDSPEILAEVGCCYDVLMNRLDKPVERPKNCQRRLYYIAWEERVGSASGKTASPQQVEKRGETAACAGSRKPRAVMKESDVQKAVRAQRSFGKRLAKLATNGLVAASVLVLGAWGYSYWTADNGSETFEVAGEVENTVDDAGAELGTQELADNEESQWPQDDEYDLVDNDFITEEYAENEPSFNDEVSRPEPLRVALNDPTVGGGARITSSSDTTEYGLSVDERRRYVMDDERDVDDSYGSSTSRYGEDERSDLLPSEALEIPLKNYNVFNQRMRY